MDILQISFVIMINLGVVQSDDDELYFDLVVFKLEYYWFVRIFCLYECMFVLMWSGESFFFFFFFFFF